ncbi:hypothetical protein SVA_1256 [Sulfurifustis variabilis]|uniref:Uncharacterized protein n=1 Tax=Sulfurifustis variabilis TaxID=1675686 RepID=A0A1B4VBD1_9GAMM|nr:hypothetical protein [Sulfurifustis variabilis]BAU47831.1 hypothetical protein SVA_1256 [Sulfurifustis variabilis]
MPEQITKYPDTTLQVLKGAGARCGEGADQNILKQCPAERFCALPTGEMCIYGVAEIPQMTQVTTAEVAQVVCPPNTLLPGGEPVAAGIALAAGLVAGVSWRRRRS